MDDATPAFLVDSHCHLDFPDFGDELDAVVARAGEAGVAYMVTISTHLSRFERVKAVAERFDNVFCTVGIHPHQAATEPLTTPEQLADLASHPKVVGIGETGLDFYYEHSPRDVQQTQFRAHIQAARATGLPLIVHTRDADDDTLRVMDEEYREGGPFPGLIHCFSSGRAVAEKAMEMGLYISVSGIVTFKTADDLRATVKDVPLDRLLVETDSPYLAPVPQRGRRNEPAFTALTAAKVAELKGVPAEDLARRTSENFFTLFAKAARAVRNLG
ncbi:MAG: LuxR family transcriptional regulator [Rhodospirillales bacterium CG15_BIG_FIL_POST_REV_8_21_14_020_66_15]|nr:MAG: LuxR family transcriptional regulator [Rhodospirillales bacterium CG15_BIG_FIL_POST_REV_8_21_14_020_66_15]